MQTKPTITLTLNLSEAALKLLVELTTDHAIELYEDKSENWRHWATIIKESHTRELALTKALERAFRETLEEVNGARRLAN